MTHTGIEITADLLRDQHPDLARYPMRLGEQSARAPVTLGSDGAVTEVPTSAAAMGLVPGLEAVRAVWGG